MNGQPIALVCFDMAGTTVLDDGVVEAAFLDALSAVGIDADDQRQITMLDYVRTTMGTSKITVFRSLFADEQTAQAANAAFEAAYEAHLELGEVRALPGAQEVIEKLRAKGVRVALLTGFSARTRDRLIATLGWQQIADLLLCPDEAGRGRPYPDMILTAVLRLQITDVAQVAVVGDTCADIVSGLRSGASQVIGVLSGADGEERLRAAGATDVLDSIVDLPPLIGL